LFSHPNYIDVIVQESPEKIWRLTGIYGEPRWEDKYKTWDRMRELHAQNNLPWVTIGDFNEILYSHEKEGGNTRPQHFMQAFRDAVNDCNLEDIGFSGDPFTWRRGRIRERLDRELASSTWITMHPEASLQHLECMRSDHRPILLDTDPRVSNGNSGKVKRFEGSGSKKILSVRWWRRLGSELLRRFLIQVFMQNLTIFILRFTLGTMIS
jgi:hypothetical protein